MKVNYIKLNNYRNYDFLNVHFSEDTNIFFGDNAQGKTNLIEAVFLCATTKSHRGTKDKDIIKFGEEEAHIEVSVKKKGVDSVIDIHLKKNNPKGIAVNKIPIKKTRELFGVLNVVFFSPEDLGIIKNSPVYRRRFLDIELSQLNTIYINLLMKYNSVVNQRNHLLKNPEKGMDTLDIWDEQLLYYGKQIIELRKEFINEINKKVSVIHKKLTGGREIMTLIYEPGYGHRHSDFERSLKRSREKDIRMRSTSVGPHRDDLGIIVNEIDMRKFGSQGQQRTAALSLKLAEIEIVKDRINDTPVLLMDDVLSELDKKRQNFLLEGIEGIQTFMTCTGIEDYLYHHYNMDYIFHVENGHLHKQS